MRWRGRCIFTLARRRQVPSSISSTGCWARKGRKFVTDIGYVTVKRIRRPGRTSAMRGPTMSASSNRRLSRALRAHCRVDHLALRLERDFVRVCHLLLRLSRGRACPVQSSWILASFSPLSIGTRLRIRPQFGILALWSAPRGDGARDGAGSPLGAGSGGLRF